MKVVFERRIITGPRHGNRYMTDFQVLSRRQVEFGIFLRSYRRINNLSLKQLANIATLRGIRVSEMDISKYELFKAVPSERKMNVLLQIMNITIDDLCA